MKKQTCQAKTEAKSWDDLIDFTNAKIKELKQALTTFRRNKEQGLPMPGAQSLQHSSATRN
ncbi:MAG: hypothetical protein ACHQIK_19570 [Candidatus Acidiferrales bacterium]